MIAIFPEISNCAAQGDVERLAVLCRQYFGGDETAAPQIDLLRIFQDMGISVGSQNLDSFGAIAVKDERGRFQMALAYQRGLALEEERFLLAHMIGHVLFDLQPRILAGELKVSGLKETVSPLQRYTVSTGSKTQLELDIEARADAFAAALLLPAGMLKRAVEKLQELDKVARFFKITRLCVERRLETLGILEVHPNNFMEAEANLGHIQTVQGDVQRKPLDLSKLQTPKTLSQGPRGAASQTYKQTSGAPNLVQTQAKPVVPVAENFAKDPNELAEQSLLRIRKLAQRIDRSVKVS
jgi:Zn-dependent peptidase ImmA (M78 family)